MKLNKWATEIWLLGIAVAILWVSPWLIRLYDPSAKVWDGAYLFKVAFAAFALTIAMGFVKMTMQLGWGPLDDYLENFREHFNVLTSWHKAVISFWLFSLLLLAFVALVIAMD